MQGHDAGVVSNGITNAGHQPAAGEPIPHAPRRGPDDRAIQDTCGCPGFRVPIPLPLPGVQPVLQHPAP